jgi:crotonobetainyl-CoA:carnitine CoA-transferase CaiB-like acyl-CoA transferase
MTDGLLAHHYFPHADLDAGGEPQAQRTLLTGGVACYRVYRTADGRHLAVGALEFKFWKGFCTAVGLADLVERHWTCGEAPGSDAARDTIARVAERIAQRTCDAWVQVFATVDCCVTPVLTPAEALAHPHHRARGLVRSQGEVTEVGPLAQMSGHEWIPAAAPAQGEHTRAVLAQAGWDEAAIEALVRSGVVKGH